MSMWLLCLTWSYYLKTVLYLCFLTFSGVYPIFEYLDVQDPSFLLYTVISSQVRKCHSLPLLVSVCKGLEAIYATSINLVHMS